MYKYVFLKWDVRDKEPLEYFYADIDRFADMGFRLVCLESLEARGTDIHAADSSVSAAVATPRAMLIAVMEGERTLSELRDVTTP